MKQWICLSHCSFNFVSSWDVDRRSSQWCLMYFTSKGPLLFWQRPEEMWGLPILLIWLIKRDQSDPVWHYLEKEEKYSLNVQHKWILHKQCPSFIPEATRDLDPPVCPKDLTSIHHYQKVPPFNGMTYYVFISWVRPLKTKTLLYLWHWGFWHFPC